MAQNGFSVAQMLHLGFSQLRDRPALRLVAGYCLLVLHLFSATPLAPVFTTVLAMADRSHHLVLRTTDQGMQVVLHHEGSNSFGHRHGVVAQALTSLSLAKGTAGGHPDHVIQFVTTPPWELNSAPPLDPGADALASELAPLSLPAAQPFLEATAFFAAPPPAPPRNSTALFAVGSTVLLI